MRSILARIASANAISDVYAMGGKPVLAIAVLGWPVEKLPASLAQQVLEGSRKICFGSGNSAGGRTQHRLSRTFLWFIGKWTGSHSEPEEEQYSPRRIYSLSRNRWAWEFFPLRKRSVLKAEHLPVMIEQMTSLNAIGEKLGKLEGVTAMTDVTGFGLLGHLIEIAEGSGLSAEINYPALPVADGVREYLAQRIVPDATYRNWNSYSKKVSFEKE